jgi:hypothetical protein
MRTKKWMMLVGAALIAVALAACGTGTNKTIKANASTINADLARLQKAEPLPILKDSADLRIQNEYYTAEADPNKIWYLETLSMTGSVEASYTIRGPVENEDDQVTNPQQAACDDSGDSAGCVSIGLAEPNGIYTGASDDHIAILTDGAILRFEGQFQTSDQPFTIHTPVTLTENANAPISKTDLSKTVHGVIPAKG